MIQIKRTEEDMIWTEIDSIVIEACLDSISMLEMKAYKYMSHMDSLSETEKMDIVTNAQLCASQYGRGVHLMRAIASAYDTTDFRVYDIDCESELENRRIKINEVGKKRIDIYPNPSAGIFVIKSPQEDLIKSIHIMDYSGHLIYHKENPDVVHTVNIQDMASGLYFVQVKYGDGRIEVEKIIINK